MKRLLACALVLVMLLSILGGCGASEGDTTTETQPQVAVVEGVKINLSDDGITVDGESVTNDSSKAVYTANDIVFYLAGQGFTYGEGTQADAHEQSEADAHTVVHITKPGKYVVSGKLSAGQIAVDLGEDAETDPDAVVTLVLNGVDITCTVAPAVIFYNVYECGNSDTETATKDVDTSAAGANVVIADGTVNNVNGSYVAKIYKSYELNEDGTEVVDSKKLHKYDAAVYSKKTINIDGGENDDGILNINAENEGLDSELHMTINGGIINITAGNDGINTNEDYVSVTTINGGTVNILCNGSTGEGDGIDSNGWLVINGGTVNAQACATSGDAGIDSDMGIYINGGSVVASGNMLDKIAGGNATYAVFGFTSSQAGNGDYILKNDSGEIVGEYSPENAFTYLLVSDSDFEAGNYTFYLGDLPLSAVATGNMDRPMGGQPGGQGGIPQMPEGEVPQMPEGEVPQMPEGEVPQMPDGEIPQMPEGEVPQMPEGGMVPPEEGFNMGNGEPSTTFVIKAGGNQFSSVKIAE